MVIPPEKVLALLDNLVVPAPIWSTEPVPLMACVMLFASERLNANMPLSTTPAVPSVPVVPPLPTCKVPALIVVVPLYVFVAVSTVVPVPFWFNVPVPLMALATVMELLRLNTNEALSVTAPVPKVPVVPPSPICKVPAVMVVTPEYVLAPVRICVPVPILFRGAGPLSAPEKVAVPAVVLYAPAAVLLTPTVRLPKVLHPKETEPAPVKASTRVSPSEPVKLAPEATFKLDRLLVHLPW